jgi:TPR repeat protein
MKRLFFVLILAVGLAAGCGGGGSDSGATSEGRTSFEQGDYSAAYDELAPLAEAGDADAQFKIGFLFLHGQGVPLDYHEADSWIRRSAQQGHAEAQYNLAMNYELGRGVAKDVIQSYVWSTLAANQGYRAASDLREDIVQRMSEDEVIEARRLATEWQPSS